MTTPPHPRANPVLDRYTFRRAMSPLAPPASWPARLHRIALRDARGRDRVGVLLQRVRISHKEDVPLDTEGVTLRPKGAVPIQPTAR